MSFRGKRIERNNNNEDNKSKSIETVDQVRSLLGLLLKEISNHDCRQLHLENLRNALINEEVLTLAAEELLEEDKTRLRLLK